MNLKTRSLCHHPAVEPRGLLQGGAELLGAWAERWEPMLVGNHLVPPEAGNRSVVPVLPVKRPLAWAVTSAEGLWVASRYMILASRI